jgi:hypothetical protein
MLFHLHLKKKTISWLLLDLWRGKGLHVIVEDGAAVEPVCMAGPLPASPPRPLVGRRLAGPGHNKTRDTRHLTPSSLQHLLIFKLNRRNNMKITPA